MKAMILLGVNCGFGNTDVAALPLSAVYFDGGYVDLPRPKTAIPRRCPLWAQTLAVLREAISARPEPKDEVDADMVFITRFGHLWMRTTRNGKPINNVGHELDKLLKRLKMKREGVNFYALRHTFETIGIETLDQAAVGRVMGHERDDMPTRYRQRIDDDRLRRVTDHVYKWLFGK